MLFNFRGNLIEYITIIPFYLAILMWSLIPSRVVPNIYLSNIPLNPIELSLFLIILPYMILILGDKYFFNFIRSFRSACIFIGLGIYTIISLFYSNSQGIDRDAAYITIIYYTATFLFAYAFIIMTRVNRKYMIWLTILLTIVSAIYLSQSLFSLGLRAIAYTDFGIDRVKGPLFSPATGHVILLPAIGLLLDEVINYKNRNTINIICILVLFLTIVGLGSRAGLLCAAFFIVFSIVTVGDLKKRLLLILTTLIVASVSYSIIFSKADSNRLNSLEDQSREFNLTTAQNVFNDGTLIQKVFGHGYSTVWPWYMLDRDGGDLYTSGQVLQYSNEGYRLYHPHSTLLFSIVELGVFGTTVVFSLVIIVIYKIFKNRLENLNIFLGVSILSTFIANLFDFFLFKNFVLSSIWLIYIIYFIISTPGFKIKRNYSES